MNKREYSLKEQENELKRLFPSSKIKRYKNSSIKWECEMQPTEFLNKYKVLLKCVNNKVHVFILEPKPLKLPCGNSSLPHVYSHVDQRLCLFYPKEKEFDPKTMLFAHTIVPWISEWLLHYEIWLISGKWFGGGIEH